MRMYDIIEKKRNKEKLSKSEIQFFVTNYTNGTIPDYQASALLMAIFLNKMDFEETLELTKSIVNSGDVYDLSEINGFKADKHSTGGVGDSTTLILGPLVASCGIRFPKMSGRGLGHTGGTLDKLESIPGFNVELSKEEFINNVNKINIAISSQTGNITPADKKLYALRDVTATVDNLSLITSSIMGKKLAIKSDGIILDVKVGSGAFMKDLESANSLAKMMVKIGNSFGRKTNAIISNMDQPLGNAIGNSLEVIEAINVLNGEGPNDITELSLSIASKILVLSGLFKNECEAREILIENIRNKKAISKFVQLVEAQGGDKNYILNPKLFTKPAYEKDVIINKEGYVSLIDSEDIGKAALILGAGRETIDSEIDLDVGLILNKKINDYVEKGDSLVKILGNNKEKIEEAENRILQAYHISNNKVEDFKLIYGEIYD